jgi:hypothetical protein
LSGKRKMIAVVTTLCVGVGFTAVPLASAYPIPIGAGLPGGQPTKPQGGSSASKSLTKTVAVSLAGYTGLELALRTPSVKFNFPASGSVSCSASVGKAKYGSGSASNGGKGSKTFSINLTNNGRTYLYNHNGQAISLSVKCTFTPKKGAKSTSTSTVVLAA